MNTIIGNSLYSYRGTQQVDKQNHIRIRNDNLGSAAEQLYENVRIVKTKDSGISIQEAYERICDPGKAIPEVEQDEECEDMFIKVSDVKEEVSLDGEANVTEIGVASLPNGVSFYFNEDTGEVSCVNDSDTRPGRHVLWSKTLSPGDWEKCDKLFDNYKDAAAGGFIFRYRAYLMHEEFWDMYLEGKVDLATLTENDDMLSEDELYNKFHRNTVNKDR